MSSKTTLVRNKDLQPGMKVVVPSGDILTIEGDVRPSCVSAGQIVAETDIGPVYFADDRSTRVLDFVSRTPAPAEAAL